MGPLFVVPVGAAGFLLDKSTSSSFLISGDISTSLLQFSTTYCNALSCKFWKLFLKFWFLFPSPMSISGTFPLKVFVICEFVFFLWRFCVFHPLLSLSLSQSWSTFWCSLRAWVCVPLVSPCPFSQMLPLGVSWWGSLLIISLLSGSSLIWGLPCFFFFLIYQGSNWGTCIYFLSNIEVLIWCLLLIFVNVYLIILFYYLLK